MTVVNDCIVTWVAVSEDKNDLDISILAKSLIRIKIPFDSFT